MNRIGWKSSSSYSVEHVVRMTLEDNLGDIRNISDVTQW